MSGASTNVANKVFFFYTGNAINKIKEEIIKNMSRSLSKAIRDPSWCIGDDNECLDSNSGGHWKLSFSAH